MRATDFEFRHRFWFIFPLFWAGFSAYWLDHKNVAGALVQLFVPSGEIRSSLQLVFGVAALLDRDAPCRRGCGTATRPIR